MANFLICARDPKIDGLVSLQSSKNRPDVRQFLPHSCESKSGALRHEGVTPRHHERPSRSPIRQPWGDAHRCEDVWPSRGSPPFRGPSETIPAYLSQGLLERGAGDRTANQTCFVSEAYLPACAIRALQCRADRATCPQRAAHRDNRGV